MVQELYPWEVVWFHKVYKCFMVALVMFGKKAPCPRCKSALKDDFSFCPRCGIDLRNPQQELENYGLLGRDEFSQEAPMQGGGSMGFSDKLIGSIFNQLMKSLESQMRASNNQPDVTQIPNGVTIKVGVPADAQPKRTKRKNISEEQIKRMTGLPRVEAKTNVRRLSDRVVYEMKTSDVASVEDIFVSKLAEGYEVKAIGKNKVYLNSFPVELPLRRYSLSEKGITFEFALQ